MKLSSVIRSRTGMAVVCAAAAFSGLVAVRAHADGWDKRTILTVNETIQIRETVLPPGKYVMKLYDSPSQRHVVQIFNEDQSRIINTVFAIPTQRMQPTGDTQFTYWETPAGHARAMRAWYYPGDTIGNEFPYPKTPKLLAMATVEETTARSTPLPDPTQSTETAVATEATPTTVATESTEVKAAEEVKPADEFKPAEETPAVEQAPAQPTPTPDSSASAPAQSSELPKTGSPYPLIGLGGALLLAFAGLLRLTRTA